MSRGNLATGYALLLPMIGSQLGEKQQMNLNGRIRRLEIENPLPEPEPEPEHTIADFCHEVLEAMDRGWIVEQCDNGRYRNFYFDPDDKRPTEANGLSEDERSEAYRLLYHARHLVIDFAKMTGWRSPIGMTKPQSWIAYRPNSASELRDVMRMIISYEGLNDDSSY